MMIIKLHLNLFSLINTKKQQQCNRVTVLEERTMKMKVENNVGGKKNATSSRRIIGISRVVYTMMEKVDYVHLFS